MILPKPPFCGCFDGSLCDRATGRVTFFDLPSMIGRTRVVHIPNRLFVRLTVLAIEVNCYKPNSITLASSELALNMLGASSELALSSELVRN